MRMTPPYGGLEGGQYAIVALATRFADGLPESLSAVIDRHALLPAQVSLGDGFVPLPAAGDWRPVERQVAAVSVPDVSFHRAVFRGASGTWTVWFANGAQPEVTLPAPPEGAGDLAADASVRFEAVRLPDGMSLDDLLGDGGAGDLLDVDAFAEAFSRIPL